MLAHALANYHRGVLAEFAGPTTGEWKSTRQTSATRQQHRTQLNTQHSTQHPTQHTARTAHHTREGGQIFPRRARRATQAHSRFAPPWGDWTGKVRTARSTRMHARLAHHPGSRPKGGDGGGGHSDDVMIFKVRGDMTG